jgi:hypothetical protein
MISRYITLTDKNIPHAGLFVRIHKSKSTEEGKRGEDSVRHQQADTARDDDESPDVGQQTQTASDEKKEIPPR